MKHAFLPLAALVADFAFFAPAARGEALDTAPFSFKIPVTVSGYAGSAELTDFPVLVTLSAGAPTGFDYADCATDGSDLRFADATGALLSHEIETWDTNGTSYVWVKVPSLVGTATTFSGYYGTNGTAALPAVAATDVWSRYAAVFHGGATIADATGHATSITPNGATAAATGGMAGGVMTKGSATGVTFSNPVMSGALSSIGSFSFSGWFRKSGGTTSVVFSNKGNGEWNGNGFLALVESGNYFSVGVGVNGSGGHQPTSNNNKGKLAVGTWGHLAFSYDKAATSLDSYFNGDTIYSTSSARNILDPGKSVWAFGGFFDGNKNCFQGDMDEVRVLNGTASADWIKAEYDSVATPAAFAVPGTVEAVDHSAPVLGTPVLSRTANGSFTVSVEVSGSVPAAIVCTAGGTDFAMTTVRPCGGHLHGDRPRDGDERDGGFRRLPDGVPRRRARRDRRRGRRRRDALRGHIPHRARRRRRDGPSRAHGRRGLLRPRPGRRCGSGGFVRHDPGGRGLGRSRRRAGLHDGRRCGRRARPDRLGRHRRDRLHRDDDRRQRDVRPGGALRRHHG